MTKDEALKLALEALEYIDLCDNDRDFLSPHECFQLDEAITAIKQAIAEPVQEPVAWINAEKRTFEWNGPVLWNTPTVAVMDKIPLYTTPPAQEFVCSTGLCHYKAQREWVGLTDESVVSAAARVLSDRVAASCNVDCGDMWMLHCNDSIEDARAMLEAAEAKLKEKNT